MMRWQTAVLAGVLTMAGYPERARRSAERRAQQRPRGTIISNRLFVGRPFNL